jgi:signal transduction histidine kinase
MQFKLFNRNRYDSRRNAGDRRHPATIISIILSIVVISYVLFFYLQSNIEKTTKDSLVAQQTKFQAESTKKISSHISSDLNSVLVALHGIANSVYLQQGDLSSDGTKTLMQEMYSHLNTITIVDRLFILNKTNVATIFIVPKGQTNPFFGSDNVSFEDLTNQTRTKLVPAFSNGFKGFDNKYRIAITYPIVDRETKRYIGTIAALIPTVEFFEHYGNVHDISTQYLTAYDTTGTYLATPVPGLLGKGFFNETVQRLVNYNPILNQQIRQVVLAGQPAEAMYDSGRGERLSTGYPIYEQGQPLYSIFVVTPTSVIYSQVNHVLFLERIEMFLLLAGTTAATAVLLLSILKWNNSLGKEVKRRTQELEQLNERLGNANEQLELHDKMQKEFINIAAHELRTPLQPIISYSSLALKNKVDKSEAIAGIDRQARRLQKLTSDLLAVSRIEGGKLTYKMEKIRINDLILEVVNTCAAAAHINIYDLGRSNLNEEGSIIIGGDSTLAEGRLPEQAQQQPQQRQKQEQKLEEHKKGFELKDREQRLERQFEQEKYISTNDYKKNPQQEAKGRELSIELDLDPDTQEIYGDRDRIDEVLFNIINNAIKFTSKGKISIESRRQRIVPTSSSPQGEEGEDKIEIKISDTGSGIPNDILPHLFGKFVTNNPGIASGMTRVKGDGIGLGLYISKAIVTAHNGEITAYNNDGGGATFDIILPIYQKEKKWY